MSLLINMIGLLSVMALGTVAQAADCCKPGGDCCKPGASCCKK